MTAMGWLGWHVKPILTLWVTVMIWCAEEGAARAPTNTKTYTSWYFMHWTIAIAIGVRIFGATHVAIRQHREPCGARGNKEERHVYIVVCLGKYDTYIVFCWTPVLIKIWLRHCRTHVCTGGFEWLCKYNIKNCRQSHPTPSHTSTIKVYVPAMSNFTQDIASHRWLIRWWILT